jgi:hypothetical protein
MELINWGRYILSQNPTINWSKLVKFAHGLLCHEHSTVKKIESRLIEEMKVNKEIICEALGKRMEKDAQAKQSSRNHQNLQQKVRNALKKSIEIVQSLMHSSGNKFVDLFRSADFA